MADSTLVQNFFRELEDPTLFERIDDVPVFGPHVRSKKAPDGTWQEVKVDWSTLERIASTVNSIERDKGTLPVITAGHRKLDPRVDEQDQPQPWGYARNLKPGWYVTPEGRRVPTLLGTQYLSKTVRAKDGTPANEAARTFPFRSVDYYADTNEISGIALLRRDPELELGMLAYGKVARPLFHYSSENTMDPTNPPDANAGMEGMDELSPDEAATADRYAKHYEKHHPAWQHMCSQFAAQVGGGCGEGAMGAAGGSMPPAKPSSLSGTNGSMPAPEKKKEPDMMATDKVPEQYARELAIRDARIAASDKKNEALEARLVTLETQLHAEQKTRVLTQYQAAFEKLRDIEGYEIDVKDEMEVVEDYSPEQFQKHLGRVRKMAKQAPVGKRVIHYAADTDGAEGGLNNTDGRLPEDVQEQVYQYMRETRDMDYDKAVSVVRSRMNGAAK